MTMTSGGWRLAIARRAGGVGRGGTRRGAGVQGSRPATRRDLDEECDYRNEGLGTARSGGTGTLIGSRQVEPRGKSMGTAIDSEPTAIDLFNELHCSKLKEDMHAREALTSSSGPPSTNDSIWTGNEVAELGI
uniref:Uncharacterized protein n=1 Tax=Oryza rufipogon TaxID=4529 RepID=A0A0E0P7K1_ORYRU